MARLLILFWLAVLHFHRHCLDSVVILYILVGTLTYLSLPNIILTTGLYRNGFGRLGLQSTKYGCTLGLDRQKNHKCLPVPKDTVQKTTTILLGVLECYGAHLNVELLGRRLQINPDQ